jgi:hypothetical protein
MNNKTGRVRITRVKPTLESADSGSYKRVTPESERFGEEPKGWVPMTEGEANRVLAFFGTHAERTTMQGVYDIGLESSGGGSFFDLNWATFTQKNARRSDGTFDSVKGSLSKGVNVGRLECGVILKYVVHSMEDDWWVVDTQLEVESTTINWPRTTQRITLGSATFMCDDLSGLRAAITDTVSTVVKAGKSLGTIMKDLRGVFLP